jgi:hypothetical protein
MVQILPQKTNIGNEIGQALREGIGRGSEIGLQRGMLQNAISGLGDLPADTTPGQLAQKLIFATAGIPGAERYVQPLYQALSQDLAARQQAESEKIRSSSERTDLSGQQPPGYSSTLSFSELQNTLGERYFPNVEPPPTPGSPESLKPQKPLSPPTPIGPAEEALIRQKLRASGITNPQVVDQEINKVKQYQKDFYQAQKEGFSNIEEYQKARQQADIDFFQDSEMRLGEAHGKMTEGEKSIWKELSRQYADAPASERFANTEQAYNTLIGQPLIEFENSQRGLPTGSILRPGEIQTRLNDARTSVQDHLRRIDERKDLPENLRSLIKNQLRNQYFNAMGMKDYGIAQAAYAVSNLSPNTEKLIPKASKPKETLFETVYMGSPKEREKSTFELANALSRISPEDSLLLIREKALQNNFDDQAFNEALNIAIQSGRLKLSDYQANERNKLSIPQRLDLDSIMEGKRSVFDFFKGKQ